MTAAQERILTRDCDAVQIPSGEKTRIPAGSRVLITQRLGGSFTVMTDFGLARIAGEQADALGEELPASAVPVSAEADGAPPDSDALWGQLKKVYDPEIPVNIVDLGLVYSLEVAPAPESQGHRVEVQMTLTAPGCGMGPAIAEDARSKILQVPGVSEADVRIVWEPAWNQSMISDEGKMVLGLI